MTRADDKAEIVSALLAPLTFVARNAYAHLERVQDLPATLNAGLTRLLAATCGSPHEAHVKSLFSLLPDAQSSRSATIVQLQKLTQALQRWPDAALSAVPAKPVADPQKTSLRSQKSRAPIAPATPLGALPGVGERVLAQLASRKLHTVADLLHFLPRRYQGVSGYQALGELSVGMVASVEGQISAVSDRFVRGRRTLEVVIVDGTGSLHLVWFRVPGRSFVEQFRRGHTLRAAGSVKRFRQAMQMVHPDIMHVADSGHEPRIDVGDGAHEEDAVIPLYLDVEGLYPRTLRRIMRTALGAAHLLHDPLPEGLRHKRALCPLSEAIEALHAPPPDVDVDALQSGQTRWHRRLIYDELLTLQLGLLWLRQSQKNEQLGPAMPMQRPMLAMAKELLPFAATAAQERVLTEIAADFSCSSPMNRLLQGDVGSGKTAVALTAAYAAHSCGLQSALMVPTELLAEQHAKTAAAMMDAVGMRTALLTGSIGGKARRQVFEALKSGDIHLVIGTHALIQEQVGFHALGLAIIDEQHRFGVLQRARLTELGQKSLRRTPHMLVMTATPIPRTLALTVYGDLDVSVIDALPPGRRPIVTTLHRDGERAKVYAAVAEQVSLGRQAYVVFPLVEDSDKEGMDNIRAAISSAEELAAGPLKSLSLGLLHGRLSADEKDAVMRAFVRGDMQVLVATTVIEVGIDVPNASVMVIEHAERFGLSQLHQLRGRIGRGSADSSCYLLARARPSEDAWRRLEIMVQTQDGFRVAEEDLAIRGPGDFVGTRQSGLPVLTLADLGRDQALLHIAREDAKALLLQDPQLEKPQHRGLRAALSGMWADRLRILQVG